MMEYLSGFFKHDEGMIYDTRQTEVCQSFFLKTCFIKMCSSQGKLLTLHFFTPNLLTFVHNLLAGPQTLVFVFTVVFFPHLLKFLCPPTEEVHVFLLFCNVRVLLFHV